MPATCCRCYWLTPVDLAAVDDTGATAYREALRGIDGEGRRLPWLVWGVEALKAEVRSLCRMAPL